jgi:hypothetical protein
MAEDDFSVTLEPVEDLYGGGTRTRHVILKRKHGALTQSVFSCPVLDKMAPNRDYPYEGLCAVLNGDNWKFIDAIAIGLKIRGKNVPLKPGPVKASPWAWEYSYDADGRALKVTYYLCEADGCLGYVAASAPGGTSVVFEPYFDIRYMYDASRPEAHVARLLPETLAVSVDGRTACVNVPAASFRESRHEVEWRYKLGSGDRRKVDGHVRPLAETRKIVSFYEIESSGSEATLWFSCGESESRAMELMRRKPAGMQEDLARARAIRGALLPNYKGTERERNVVWRAIGMSKFGMMADGARFQEAGEFWFKSVWFRDQFEGLMHNYETIRRLNAVGCIRSILLESFKLQDKWGRLPNRYISSPSTEKYDYNSADATLLALVLAGMVVRDTNDGELAKRSARALEKYLQGVSADTVIKDGPPMLKPNGLLAVPAWHSWTDGFHFVHGTRMPIRMSAEWAMELVDKGKADEVYLARFLLPEVNAQWIRCLEAGWLFSKYSRDFLLSDRCRTLYHRALKAYKPLFYNEHTHYVNNMASADESALGRRIDPATGSPGLVAAAMLGTDLFTPDELGAIARTACKKLLRRKRDMAFGVAVKETDKCIYYTGEDYHEGVVWPRDTPYLIRLLSIAGEAGLVGQLLESNLRHQMEEGFVFYNQELFSCDHDWTPVKDPVQWWSQWVDPYLEQRPG